MQKEIGQNIQSKKTKGISADYWEQLTLAEHQNEKIREVTVTRLREDAVKRGIQYVAELGSVLRQKARLSVDKELIAFYMAKYDEFTGERPSEIGGLYYQSIR